MLLMYVSLLPLNPCSADDLVENFNLNIDDIDVIATYKVKINSGTQKTPWRKAASVTAQKKNPGRLNASGVKQMFIFTMTSIKRASVPTI